MRELARIARNGAREFELHLVLLALAALRCERNLVIGQIQAAHSEHLRAIEQKIADDRLVLCDESRTEPDRLDFWLERSVIPTDGPSRFALQPEIVRVQ